MDGPPSTPKRRRMDRFVPQETGQDLQAAFRADPGSSGSETDSTYSLLLRTELYDGAVPLSPSRTSTLSSPERRSRNSLPSTPSTLRNSAHSSNLLRFSPQRQRQVPVAELVSKSPVRPEVRKALLAPRKKQRAVPRVPYKVLDAPQLADDFYLNLLDWGENNTLAVALWDTLFIWDAASGQVNELCNLYGDQVTAVQWMPGGTHIAVGTDSGTTQIWDVNRKQRLRNMGGHTERVSCLSWNSHVLSSGSRDSSLCHRDVRACEPVIARLKYHRGEVCGLKWNPGLGAMGHLASGCNDNQLIVWDGLTSQPLHELVGHTAAVKALGWSPHQRGLLASGGGTNDRRLCFWNTTTGKLTNSVDTGSQVCNLVWSQLTRELVSTHGFSESHIAVWKYPELEQVAKLTGHSERVVHLGLSPDARTIVTGAGDETLRLWDLFEEPRTRVQPSPVDLFGHLR